MRPRDLLVSAFPVPDYRHIPSSLAFFFFFNVRAGIKLICSWLHGRHFVDWAIALTPLSPLIILGLLVEIIHMEYAQPGIWPLFQCLRFSCPQILFTITIWFSEMVCRLNLFFIEFQDIEIYPWDVKCICCRLVWLMWENLRLDTT